jgi:hypothetical protein
MAATVPAVQTLADWRAHGENAVEYSPSDPLTEFAFVPVPPAIHAKLVPSNFHTSFSIPRIPEAS